MQIEPRCVEPGFVKRWTLQSFSLIFRSPLMWGLIILISFLGSQFVSHTLWFLFFGGWIFTLSIEIAAQTDKYSLNVNSFINCIVNACTEYIKHIQNNKVFLLMFTLFVLAFDHYIDGMLSASIGNNPIPSSQDSIFSPLYSTVLFGYLFFNNGGKLKIFSYLLRRNFESQELVVIWATCNKASIRNPKVTQFFELFLFIGLIIFSIVIPFSGVLFVAFVPCLIYVAFREIFLGQTENQTQEQELNISELIPIKIPPQK